MSQKFHKKNALIYVSSWACIFGYKLIENWFGDVCFGIVILILAFNFPIFVNDAIGETEKSE